MAINQTIGSFITAASRRDFARDNLFRVMQLNCQGLALSEEDLVYCKGANLSGREVIAGEHQIDIGIVGVNHFVNLQSFQGRIGIVA